MEFAGQRGDAISPWSVGKYAKRSATIHLCSEDCQVQETAVFETAVVGYVPNQGGKANVTVVDRAVNGANPIRAAIPRLAANEGFVRIHNPAAGLAHDTTKLTLGGLNDNGVLTVGGANVADFTVLGLENLDYHQQADDINIFTPHPVRKVDDSVAVHAVGTNSEDKMIVASQGLAIAGSAFVVERYGDRFDFYLPIEMFPGVADADIKGTGTALTRLCKDAGLPQETFPSDQIDKGYVLHLIDWDQDDGSENDLGEANQYFVSGLTYLRPAMKSGLSYLVLQGDVTQIPTNLLAALNLDANVNGVEKTFGGVAYKSDGALDPTITSATVAEGRGNGTIDNNPAGRIYTWNLFPATKIDVVSHGFASSTDNHCNYTVTIPNTIGYPEHKRCLVQVQSLSCHNEALFVPDHDKRLNPVYVGVEVQGLGAQSNFSSHVTLSKDNRFDGNVADSNVVAYLNLTNGVNALSYQNNRSILDDGVLCSSPFGKQLRIKLLNLTNKDLLNTNASTATAIRDHTDLTDLINNPTHLTLRLLFLDDDDLPMR